MFMNIKRTRRQEKNSNNVLLLINLGKKENDEKRKWSLTDATEENICLKSKQTFTTMITWEIRSLIACAFKNLLAFI